MSATPTPTRHPPHPWPWLPPFDGLSDPPLQTPACAGHRHDLRDQNMVDTSPQWPPASPPAATRNPRQRRLAAAWPAYRPAPRLAHPRVCLIDHHGGGVPRALAISRIGKEKATSSISETPDSSRFRAKLLDRCLLPPDRNRPHRGLQNPFTKSRWLSGRERSGAPHRSSHLSPQNPGFGTNKSNP
ncbi:MAG: hypothetical protein CM1200mP20_09950 [Pseudomonadota bacterium]|nr:MAG: hypothetical protein CM1200mP20_09950 [Pseudomonadota bacterium]